MTLASFHGGHSRFADGTDGPVVIARAARKRKFVAFGFTEHFDMPPEAKTGNWLEGRPDSWLAQYVGEVQTARAEHTGEMDVLLGAEIDFIRGARDSTKAAVSHTPFDYFVGSIHHVRIEDRDVCIQCDRVHTLAALQLAGTSEALQLLYYDHVVELLDWKLVTVIAHLDVFKKCLTDDELAVTSAVRARVADVLEAIRDAGCTLDVNAGGFRSTGEQYPATWILREAQRVGVPVTLGDDSHGPKDVGVGLDRALDVLRSVGYTEMSLVRGHRELDVISI